jgi:cell division protein FtsW (lipid II flippase)
VVAAAAALAVTTRSLPVAIVLVAGLTVDIAAAPDLATTEHLIAVVVGVSFAMAGRWRTTRSCTTSSLRPGTQAVP